MKRERLAWIAALCVWLAGLGLFAAGATPAGSIVWGAGMLAFLAIALVVWVRGRREAARTGGDKPSLIEAIIGSL